MLIGTKTKSVIRNGIRQIFALCTGKGDNRSAYEVAPFGVDSVAPNGTKSAYCTTDTRGESIILGCVNKNQIATEGETRLYAVNGSGEVVGYLHLKDSGELLLLGDSNNAVKYNELANEFNELKEKYNDLVSKWNDFCFYYVPGSPSNVGAPASLAGSMGSASTADITQCKNDRIKTN